MNKFARLSTFNTPIYLMYLPVCDMCKANNLPYLFETQDEYSYLVKVYRKTRKQVSRITVFEPLITFALGKNYNDFTADLVRLYS